MAAKPSSFPLFISRCDAAQMLSVDAQLIDKLIKRRELAAYRVGRKILLRREELLQYVERNKVQP